MAEFHLTGYGRKFYDHQLPELIKQLTRIADTLQEINSKPVKVKAESKSSFKIRTIGRGMYKLQILEDFWEIYQDMHSYNKVWRGDFVSGSEKLVVHFKERTKKEVLQQIYALYNEQNS